MFKTALYMREIIMFTFPIGTANEMLYTGMVVSRIQIARKLIQDDDISGYWSIAYLAHNSCLMT